MAYPALNELPEGWEIVEVHEPRLSDGKDAHWNVHHNGKRADNSYFDSPEEAQKIALRLAELDAVNAVIEETIGRQYHYGIQVWSEPNPGRTPTWRRTDAFRDHDGFAFAWFSDTPPPVDVYTREQYEAACAALELEPALDEDLDSYADRYGVFDVYTYDAKAIITFKLRGRRLGGLKREKAAIEAERMKALEATGLLAESAWSREQYEQACSTMGLPALSDGACFNLVDNDLSMISGGVVAIMPGMPNDEVSLKLAYKRVSGIEETAVAEGKRCDECGGVIVGSGMVASLGLACSVDCFDAMADRPGKYAQRQK